jgi:hypothetical protein
MIIRQAKISDLPALVELENESWDENLRTNEDAIRDRIINFDKGQWVLESENEIIGVLYTKRNSSIADLLNGSYEKQERDLKYNEGGKILQLCAINSKTTSYRSPAFNSNSHHVRMNEKICLASDRVFFIFPNKYILVFILYYYY